MTTNSALPAEFQIIYNTFSFCELAVYFPPLTRPGWFRNNTTCDGWEEDLTWNPAWNQPVVFRNNNFINNDFSILHQGQDAGPGNNVVIDADENFWGDGGAPGPNDIVIEVIDPATVASEGLVSADDPKPSIVLEDGDGDGLADWREVLIYGTDPNNPDSSGDGVPDGFGVALGLDPTINYQDNPSSLPMGVELADVTPDYTADENGNGIADWYETANPVAAAQLADLNNDGVRDNVDALILTGIIVGAPGFELNKFSFNRLDLNLDGVVNNVDAIILINHFLGNIPVIPLPPAGK